MIDKYTDKYVEDIRSFWTGKEKIEMTKDVYMGISDLWLHEYMKTYPHFKDDWLNLKPEEKPKIIESDILEEELKRRGVTIVSNKTEMD